MILRHSLIHLQLNGNQIRVFLEGRSKGHCTSDDPVGCLHDFNWRTNKNITCQAYTQMSYKSLVSKHISPSTIARFLRENFHTLLIKHARGGALGFE